MERFSPHLSLAHAYWKGHLRPGDIAIDATCGNGHDTIELARILLAHPDSLLLGLDVQQTALENTSSLLRSSVPESYIARILLHRRCHADIDLIPLPVPPRLIVYNLGYLPGSDKTITTQTPTTMQSVQKALRLLALGGALSITCYPGHPEGAKEEAAILTWAKNLPSDQWHVCHHCWINRPAAPSLFWVRGIGESSEHHS